MRRHPVRTALSIATAVILACGAAAFGPVSPASAQFGEAEISPIESDISAKSWVSVEAGSGASTADLAIDQDDRTAWRADGTSANQWLTLDLGGAYDNVRKVEVVFPSTGAVYQYVVEASADGDSWNVVADHSADHRPARGSVDLFTRPGTRFVRVTLTGASPGATLGISELSVYNYLRDDLILGADASWVDNDVAEGRKYWVSPTEEDPGAGPHLLDVLQDRGVEYVRLRVFNEPRSESSGSVLTVPYQGPKRSLEVAEWIKAERDMGLGIDLHYADSWADPAKQPKPRAWAQLEFDDLTEAVYDYTYDYVEQLIEQGTTPDKVAIGNEIVNGFLYGSEAALIGTTDPAYFRNQPEIYRSQPGGGLLWKYWGSDDPEERRLYDEAWDRFTTLSAAGIRAVRDVSADHGEDIDVETHIIIGKDRGAKTLEFWDQYLTRVKAKGADVDVLAHSYYPEWHGSPDHYESNINAVAAAHPGYKIEIAETSYPASGGGGAPMPNSTYPRTVQGAGGRPPARVPDRQRHPGQPGPGRAGVGAGEMAVLVHRRTGHATHLGAERVDRHLHQESRVPRGGGHRVRVRTGRRRGGAAGCGAGADDGRRFGRAGPGGMGPGTGRRHRHGRPAHGARLDRVRAGDGDGRRGRHVCRARL